MKWKLKASKNYEAKKYDTVLNTILSKVKRDLGQRIERKRN